MLDPRPRFPLPDGRTPPEPAGERGLTVLSPPPDAGPAEQYGLLASAAWTPRRVDAALRALDVALAGVLLLVLAPLIALVAAAILVTSGRPVLYRGGRIGRHGRVFTMLKFRTLAPDAELRLAADYGPRLTLLTESEATPLGRLLRSAQLDEIPQLWNVLGGDMSIVGPRPIRPAFFADLAAGIPQYWQRLIVRPGLTGFAQLRMTREEAWEEKLAHDLEYVADRSVSLYLRVVVATGKRVLVQSAAALGTLLLAPLRRRR